MDSRLLNYYDAELKHLQTMAVEFAKEFPRIAGRLSLTTGEFPVADPYVERLLEGFAYLSARVQLKLDAEFPRFTQTLLEIVCPHLLGPTPSMTVAAFNPVLTNPELAEGVHLPRGTVLRSQPTRRTSTTCEYRTSHPVTLLPLEIVDCRYLVREMGVLHLPDPPLPQRPRAALQIKFAVRAGMTGAKLAKLDRLPLFLPGNDAGRLYEQLASKTMCVGIRPIVKGESAQPVTWLTDEPIGRLGFSASEALLPVDARSFQGYRLLQEYFSLPQRFMFVELRGLRQGLARCQSDQFEVIVLFGKEDLALEGRVGPEDLALFATPAVNLFPRQADRVFVTDRVNEHQVIIDRTRPLDFEVYSVTGVTGYLRSSGEQRTFAPFFAASGLDAEPASARSYYAVHRVPRHLTGDEREAGRSRRSYAGSETYISLVDSECVPQSMSLSQLGIETMATNRDLPIDLSVGGGGSDFELEVAAPIKSIRCLIRPTAPRPSRAEGATAWRLISHLSLNYLSLSDTDAQSGAVALRELLKLYSDPQQAAHKEQVAGVRSVTARGHVQPVAGGGVITFARGLEVEILLEDRAFAGIGGFVLGSVLEQFLSRYVTTNSFTQTVLKTTERGEIARWKARLGQRPML